MWLQDTSYFWITAKVIEKPHLNLQSDAVSESAVPLAISPADYKL